MNDHCGRIDPAYSRRDLLRVAGGGIGMLALNSILRDQGILVRGKFSARNKELTIPCGEGMKCDQLSFGGERQG